MRKSALTDLLFLFGLLCVMGLACFTAILIHTPFHEAGHYLIQQEACGNANLYSTCWTGFRLGKGTEPIFQLGQCERHTCDVVNQAYVLGYMNGTYLDTKCIPRESHQLWDAIEPIFGMALVCLLAVGIADKGVKWYA